MKLDIEAKPDDFFPQSDTPNKKTNDVLYMLVDDADGMSRAYTDLTGRFQYRSSRGNEYVLVAYHYDANAILATPVRNRQKETLVTAWSTLNRRFSAAGVQPTTYIMDNECSDDMRNALEKQKISTSTFTPQERR